METHETHVSIETAKLLKQAGFDWTCENGYLAHSGLFTSGHFSNNSENGIAAPTLEVVKRWLREVKGIEIYAHVFYDYEDISDTWDFYVYEINHITKQIEDYASSDKVFKSYEIAFEEGIKKCLTILLEEEQQNEETNLV